MPFPAVLAAVQVPVPALAGAGTVTSATTLIVTQSQLASRWCWLAVAASVDACHGGQATQCWLAHTLLGQHNCCQQPSSTSCNQPGHVEKALQQVQHHRAPTTALHGTAPALSTVQNELGAGDPPAAQFAFQGGGNHVVLLSGHGTDASGAAVVHVGDPSPLYNPTVVVWAQAAHYRGGVQWTHAFWTKR